MTLQTTPTPGDTKWFVHDRFGLFIHWGIYSAAARHEWIKSREMISDANYRNTSIISIPISTIHTSGPKPRKTPA